QPDGGDAAQRGDGDGEPDYSELGREWHRRGRRACAHVGGHGDGGRGLGRRVHHGGERGELHGHGDGGGGHQPDEHDGGTGGDGGGHGGGGAAEHQHGVGRDDRRGHEYGRQCHGRVHHPDGGDSPRYG